jgi:CRP/FNR family cyclic AMP-dependent transcriptional regulator
MDIRKLFDTAENVEVYLPGDIIFREGDQAHGGDLMGEMAIVGSHKRTATAVATTACRLAPVTERRFVLLVQETPYFALHVMKVLTDRIVRKEHEMRAGAP